MEIKKLKVDPPYDPITPLLGIYPKESKAVYYRDNCMSMFIIILFTIAKLWNQSDKENVKYIQSGVLLAIEKNKIMYQVTHN
jgi:hypothetical protein